MPHFIMNPELNAIIRHQPSEVKGLMQLFIGLLQQESSEVEAFNGLMACTKPGMVRILPNRVSGERLIIFKSNYYISYRQSRTSGVNHYNITGVGYDSSPAFRGAYSSASQHKAHPMQPSHSLPRVEVSNLKKKVNRIHVSFGVKLPAVGFNVGVSFSDKREYFRE